MTIVERILTEKASFIPRSGFNLVGLDDFGDFGEKLYLIAHFTSREAAETELERRRATERYPDRMFIYASTDG